MPPFSLDAHHRRNHRDRSDCCDSVGVNIGSNIETPMGVNEEKISSRQRQRVEKITGEDEKENSDSHDGCGGADAGSSSSASPFEHSPPDHFHRHQLRSIPERRVVFAATIVGGAAVDAVEVFPVNHRNDYTPDDKRRMWFTKTELERIQDACYATAELVSLDPAELYSPFHFRGLEHLIDESHLGYRSNGIRAVLEEQDAQRKQWHTQEHTQRRTAAIMEALRSGHNNNKNNNNDDDGAVHRIGMMDPDRIRHVYSMGGKTYGTASLARWIASLDATLARDIWTAERQENSDSDNDTDNDSDSDNHHLVPYGTNHHPLSDDLFAGVRGVFQRLITPFLVHILDIREGDIYVGIGDM